LDDQESVFLRRMTGRRDLCCRTGKWSIGSADNPLRDCDERLLQPTSRTICVLFVLRSSYGPVCKRTLCQRLLSQQ
jgi:hypothetical protein